MSGRVCGQGVWAGTFVRHFGRKMADKVGIGVAKRRPGCPATRSSAASTSVIGHSSRRWGVDPRTGIPGRFPDSRKRFASRPNVGSRYGESIQILFIGLDIERDPGRLQWFETRRRHIEDKGLRDQIPRSREPGAWRCYRRRTAEAISPTGT